jgi:hypothetical protein
MVEGVAVQRSSPFPLRHPLIVPVLLALLAPGLRAQEVRGTLIAAETGTILPFGVVELLDNNLQPVATAYSDELARFGVLAPGPGRYSLRGSHMTAQPIIAGPLDLVAGQVATVELRLALQPIELDPLMVSVRPEYRQLVRKGFYERAKTGFGTFVTPEQLEKWRPIRPTDLLRRLPGIRLETDPERVNRYVVTMTRAGMFVGEISASGGGRRCVPRIIVDDAEMWDFNLDDLAAQDIFAMEVYRSPVQVPAQYAGSGQNCGVIVVWTGIRPRTGR